jgi:2-succinyl-6-hydroxy-2,4-cyclohexadiene-1-carboxylate synthase
MLIKLSKINLNVEISISSSDSDYIFFLHGFTGDASNWDVAAASLKKNFNTVAVDLIGHGKSDSPIDIKYYKTDSIVNQLNELFNHFTEKQIFIVGYSMGGRAALSYAAKYPQKIKGLILESTTAGIEDEKSRSERIGEDESLAAFIESHSLMEFADYWMNLELFNTQRRFSNEKRNQIRKEKLQNNKTGLINM